LIAPDIQDILKQPEENLASGIYFIFIALTTALIAKLCFGMNEAVIYYGVSAFILLGIRLLLFKTFI